MRQIHSSNLKTNYSFILYRKAQDDVLTSLSELDKCRKLYFDEEHYANQARDKEEK